MVYNPLSPLLHSVDRIFFDRISFDRISVDSISFTVHEPCIYLLTGMCAGWSQSHQCQLFLFS